jgi:isoleucyl-tRNA synthetase
VQRLQSYCSEDLGGFYLDVLKDRLYTAGRHSVARRSAQTALAAIRDLLLKLMAPILSFTAEEAWAHVPAFDGKDDSVHLGEFPGASDWLASKPAAFVADMERLLAVREKVLKELEKARESKLIGNALEAKVTLAAPAAEAAFLESYRHDLTALFIVSQVAVVASGGTELAIEVAKAEGAKCERCWNYSTHVGTSAAHPTFCARCEKAVEAGRS